ncbi:MAG: aminoglycoside phosphotransferase family protein [Planctomycetes bacterium]|nr:aminoglycoside phosphotransferase family protein [Planctomycetota bacterium]
MRYLSVRTVVHHILDRGCLTRDEVVRDGVTICDRSRRNTNLSVAARAGRGVFLKQARSWEGRDPSTLEHEASFLALAARHCPDVVAEGALARCIDFDRENGVLATSLVQNAVDVRGLGDEAACARFEALGRLLARVHLAMQRAMRSHPRIGTHSRHEPWVLGLHRRPATDPGMTHGAREIRKWLLRFPELAHLADDARAQWRRETVVHGDVKTDNCLFPRAGTPPVAIVDWEMWGVGDPMWDVAGALQSVIVPAVLRHIDGAGAQRVDETVFAPARVLAASIWHGYAAATNGADPGFADARRAAVFTAGRLLQTAVEMTPSGAPGRDAATLLQLAWNGLQAPDVLREHLIG